MLGAFAVIRSRLLALTSVLREKQDKQLLFCHAGSTDLANQHLSTMVGVAAKDSRSVTLYKVSLNIVIPLSKFSSQTGKELVGIELQPH